MYSLLVAYGQLYGEFLVKLMAQLLCPLGSTDGGSVAQQQQQQQSQFGSMREQLAIRRLQPAAETVGLLFAWGGGSIFNKNNNNNNAISSNNNNSGIMFSSTLLAIIVLLLVLLTIALQRQLPAWIADRRKIQIVEYLMRLSNEYLGDLVEQLAGPVMRNRFTRFFAALPFRLFSGRAPAWCVVRTERIADVKCRVYLPQGNAKRSDALIVFIHGGGWCMGKPRFYDGVLLILIERLGLSVISIDYSLSPEVKFPVALMECERVVHALYNEKFADFGISKERIALMGDSAGANQCAVLCQRALRMNMPAMAKCQLLVYPVIHMLDFQSPSYQFYYSSYPGTGLLNPKMLARWYLFYLGVEPTPENIRAMVLNRHLTPKMLADRKLCTLLEPNNLPAEMKGQEEQRKEGKRRLENERKNGMAADGKKRRTRRRSGGGENAQKSGGRHGRPVKWKRMEKEEENEETGGKEVKNGRILREDLGKEMGEENGGRKFSASSSFGLHKQTEEQNLAERMAPFLLNPDVCPLLGESLEKHCPTMVCTAGIDILRDEGILYAQRLRDEKVPVEWKHYEAAYHGILNMYCSKERQRILDDICEYLRRNLIE